MEEVIKSILEITNQGNPRAETIVEKHGGDGRLWKKETMSCTHALKNI